MGAMKSAKSKNQQKFRHPYIYRMLSANNYLI